MKSFSDPQLQYSITIYALSLAKGAYPKFVTNYQLVIVPNNIL